MFEVGGAGADLGPKLGFRDGGVRANCECEALPFAVVTDDVECCRRSAEKFGVGRNYVAVCSRLGMR